MCFDCQKLRFDPRSAGKRSRHDIKDQSLHYKRKDQLPHLASLGSSAEKGCKLCGFLAQVIRKHVPDSGVRPDFPAMEVEVTFPAMTLWTRRNDNDLTPCYMTGQIRVGNVTKYLRIDVEDDEGECSESCVHDVGG